MIYTCHNCPFNMKVKVIDDIPDDEEIIRAKEVLKSYLTEKCKNCPKVENDEIKIKKSMKRPRQIREENSNRENEPLKEELIFDFLTFILELPPLDMLLIYHIAKGGLFANFDGLIKKIEEDYETMGKNISRQTARAKWLRMCKGRPTLRLLESNGLKKKVGTPAIFYKNKPFGRNLA